MNLVYTIYVLIAALLTYLLFIRWKLYILSLKLPGPFAWPIVGNGLIFLCDPKEILHRIVNLTSQYTSPMRLWMGHKLVIFVKDPAQLQTIMQSAKMSQKAYIYSFLEPFMGKGLFTSAGLQHKNHRKLLQPLFGPTYVEGYSYLFQKHADKLLESLNAKADDGEFDILHYLHDSAFEATMDIMLEDKNDHTYDYKDLPTYVRRFYHIFSQRVLNIWYHLDVIFKITKFYAEQQMMVHVATTLTQEITDSRVPDIEKRLKAKCDTSNADRDSRTPSMLESMMEMVEENPNILSATEFRDHMMTFVATSQDTQSSAIAFTLMMLGMHPDIQTTVMSELTEALDGKQKLDYADLEKLKYMEMCLKEAMRLFPLGPFLLRETIDDFPFGKLILPKGCIVVLGIYNVHRNKKYWEKPDEFYPEHFLEEAVATRHSYAFLPFSAGPRRCIAQKYSYANMKIIIATILQKYRIHCEGTLNDLKLMTDVSIRPIDGYMIRLVSR